jgi:hypothetical protein
MRSLDDLVEEGLARLARSCGLDGDAAVCELEAPVDRLIEQARRAVEPANGWTRLANQLELTHLEALAGALLLRCEWDAHIADRVRRLQASTPGVEGTSRPTLGLIVHLWIALEPRAQRAAPRLLALLSAGQGVESGTFVLGRGDASASARTLTLHPALIPPLLDADLGAANAASFGDLVARCMDPPPWTLPKSWADELAQMGEELRADRTARVLIRAQDISEARLVAALLAAHVGRDAVELAPAAHWPVGLEPWLIARRGLPIVVSDAAPGERAVIPAFTKLPCVVVARPDAEVAPTGMMREWRLTQPSIEERAAILRALLPDAAVAEWLARTWRASVASLHDVATVIVSRARSRGETPTIADARAAIVAHGERVAGGFGTLAQAVNTEVDNAALVASPMLQWHLDTLRTRCAHREVLTSRLGVTVKARARDGVTALFVGASGTGKTLAAQWLAHELGKPLLRVDAASITSKYIGETEKNLARLLAQAESFDCVLLFDEADALFGSRTEVRQSNDRFANAQTNYLLTRIESFGGIAILTSNSKARFDDAFMRRLDAVVEFPLPDASERAALWRAHLGTTRPKDEMINLLAAEAELAGGHIRNAAITAALLAAARGEDAAITYEDIVAGIADEYRKLGRQAPDGLTRR